MILWANLICDVPPALALGIDPPERDVLTRPPRYVLLTLPILLQEINLLSTIRSKLLDNSLYLCLYLPLPSVPLIRDPKAGIFDWKGVLVVFTHGFR